MRSLDDIFASAFKKRGIDFDKTALATSALNNFEVKTFLEDHKSELNQAIITASLSNLYKFVQQKEKQDNIIKGYFF